MNSEKIAQAVLVVVLIAGLIGGWYMFAGVGAGEAGRKGVCFSDSDCGRNQVCAVTASVAEIDKNCNKILKGQCMNSRSVKPLEVVEINVDPDRIVIEDDGYGIPAMPSKPKERTYGEPTAPVTAPPSTEGTTGTEITESPWPGGVEPTVIKDGEVDATDIDLLWWKKFIKTSEGQSVGCKYLDSGRLYCQCGYGSNVGEYVTRTIKASSLPKELVGKTAGEACDSICKNDPAIPQQWRQGAVC